MPGGKELGAAQRTLTHLNEPCDQNTTARCVWDTETLRNKD